MEEWIRERCYDCWRPASACFCDAIPRIDNQTSILILQHVGERSHPFNTARIVRKSLRQCHLITDHNQRFGQHELPLAPDAGLLYPAESARDLSELTEDEKPSQLVMIDGTWHQAHTMLRDVPQIQSLPRYRISPASPGRYRIRREPHLHSLSTLEATAAALQALEPETESIDQLITAFDRMIEEQLDHSASQAAWRRRKVRPPNHRGIPRSLLESPERLVVAYGEATPGQPPNDRLPVNWFAQRLGSGEPFSALIHQNQPLSASHVAHMRLSIAGLPTAISEQEFRRQWQTFLRPHDTLVVYHERTAQLLRNSNATLPRCLTLKSIFGKWRCNFQNLEELLVAAGMDVPPVTGCRAEHRLQMAIRVVQHLQDYAAGHIGPRAWMSPLSS